MKQCSWSLSRLAMLAVFFTGISARGQVEVYCKAERPVPLQFEEIPVTVYVVNNTSETLNVSDPASPHALHFDVKLPEGDFAKRIGALYFEAPVTVAPNKTVKFTVDLLSAYDLTRCRPYVVRARVDWSDKMFFSPEIAIDVVPGMEVERLQTGLPDGSVRIFTLRVNVRERYDHLFLRVDDGNGLCRNVADIGRVVRLYKPQLMMDDAGRLHTLHQSGPWGYSRVIFSKDGVPEKMEFYEAQQSAIRLKLDAAGEVVIEGGVLRDDKTPALTSPDGWGAPQAQPPPSSDAPSPAPKQDD